MFDLSKLANVDPTAAGADAGKKSKKKKAAKEADQKASWPARSYGFCDAIITTILCRHLLFVAVPDPESHAQIKCGEGWRGIASGQKWAV